MEGKRVFGLGSRVIFGNKLPHVRVHAQNTSVNFFCGDKPKQSTLNRARDAFVELRTESGLRS